MIDQLKKLLFDQRWGNYDFDIQQTETLGLISAGTEDTANWKIHIQVDERLKKLDEILSQYSTNGKELLSSFRKKNNYFKGKDNLDNLLYFIVGHEVGHWRYCPSHIDDREEIFAGVAEGLDEIGFTREQIQENSQRIYNYFADILDNVMNMYRDKENKRFADGFLTFYTKEGIIGKYTEDFFMFVDTIAKLGIDDKAMKNFAETFRKDYTRLNPKTKKIIELLAEDTSIADKAMDANGILTLEEKVGIYHALDDKEKWHYKAKEFAKIIGKHVKDEKEKNNSTHSSNGNANQHNHGQSEEDIRKLVRRSLEKGHSTAYAPAGIALDEIYKARAEQLAIEIQAQEGDLSKLPIGYLQREEIKDNDFDLNRVDWQNPELGLDKDGREEIEFFEMQSPFFAEKKGHEKGGQIPDILWLIDKSGSMTAGYNPERGTGPYDMLLRSAYSVFKYLEDHDQIQHMKFGNVLFESIPNYFSGWRSYFDMQHVKETMLDPSRYNVEINPKDIIKARLFGNRNIGGTNLDELVVKEAVDDNDRKFWAIVVSDGDIHNTEEAKRAISYIASKGNHISFINIGSGYSGSFSDHVREVGGDVHNVSDSSDLPKLILGKAKEIYAIQ